MKQSWQREAGIVGATTKPTLERLDKDVDRHFFYRSNTLFHFCWVDLGLAYPTHRDVADFHPQ